MIVSLCIQYVLTFENVSVAVCLFATHCLHGVWLENPLISIFLLSCFRNKGLLTRNDQHCLFYNHTTHHNVRERRQPEPSLQRGSLQSQVPSSSSDSFSASSEGAPLANGRRCVWPSGPRQSPYTPAAEYTSHALWGRRGWRAAQGQTRGESRGAHRCRGMLKEEEDEEKRDARTTLCTHGHQRHRQPSTATSALHLTHVCGGRIGQRGHGVEPSS